MKLINSFKFAIAGFLHCVKHERNFRIHLLAAVVIIALAVMFDLSRFEIVVLIFAIALVLITEMINTAIERVVDHLTTEHNESAKIAKDVAAGAVFVSAVFAAIVGAVVFIPAAVSAIRIFFNL